MIADVLGNFRRLYGQRLFLLVDDDAMRTKHLLKSLVVEIDGGGDALLIGDGLSIDALDRLHVQVPQIGQHICLHLTLITLVVEAIAT